MPELITTATAKEKFPLWEKYCVDPSGTLTNDEMLELAIDMAESEMQTFITVTSETLTNSLEMHLMNMVKYECFSYKHGDTQFEFNPAIVRQYEKTMNLLKGGLIGTGNITLQTKKRTFDSWFNDKNEDES